MWKKKKTARSTSLKLREWLVVGGLRPPDTVWPHALKIRRRLAAPKLKGLLKCVEKKGPLFFQFSPPDPITGWVKIKDFYLTPC